jgi:uncharacterized membrane protein YphA (DoxX/SURF4 family)
VNECFVSHQCALAACIIHLLYIDAVNMKSKVLLEVLVFLFIILFVYAAANKLMDHEKFVVQLGQSPMLTRWAGLVAWVIPLLEVVVSLMLVFPLSRRLGLYGFLNLMVMFTGYVIIISNFSPYVPCSCGGVLERLGWTQHLYFNLFFVGLSTVAIHLYEGMARDTNAVEQTGPSLIEHTE